MEKNKFVFPVVMEKDSDGYFAYCPAFQGCYTQGDSYEETRVNIKDAIRLHIEDYLANDEPIRTTGLIIEEFIQLL